MPGPHPEGAALLITASPAPGKYEDLEETVREYMRGHSAVHLWDAHNIFSHSVHDVRVSFKIVYRLADCS